MIYIIIIITIILKDRLIRDITTINKEDKILYISNKDEDKFLSELALKYSNTNELIFLNTNSMKYETINQDNFSKIFYKRFFLIEKARVNLLNLI